MPALVAGFLLGAVLAGTVAAFAGYMVSQHRAEQQEVLLRKQIVTLEDKQLAIQEELATAKHMGELWEHEGKKLRAKLVNHRPEQDFTALKEELGATITDLTGKLDTVTKQGIDLQAELIKTQEEWQAKHTADIAAAEQRLTDLKTETDARLAATRDSLAEATTLREQANAASESLRTDLASAQGQLEAKIKALTQAEQRSEALEQRLDELNARLVALTAQLATKPGVPALDAIWPTDSTPAPAAPEKPAGDSTEPVKAPATDAPAVDPEAPAAAQPETDVSP